MHKALLRFRSDAVSRITNVPFRQVTVRKGIFDTDNWEWCAPDIEVANLYSRKCTGEVLDRSIWNIEPAKRYIAPEDFYERLIKNVGNRVKWETSHEFNGDPVISTIPLSAHAEMFPHTQVDFKRAPIQVYRYRIPNCDVYQTVYFPNLDFPVYRASITGDLLILECIAEVEQTEHLGDLIADIFAVEQPLPLDQGIQMFGKIAPINERVRRSMVEELTEKMNIYSLGRFATWRNILLDDVVNDIDVIRQLLEADRYGARLISKKGN